MMPPTTPKMPGAPRLGAGQPRLRTLKKMLTRPGPGKIPRPTAGQLPFRPGGMPG